MSKTILITGSTDGIGLLTAKMLAEQGHKILLHGRNATKLEVAKSEVGGNAMTYRADLSSLPETTGLADKILAEHDHIDVLINNAGIFKTPSPMLPNGQDIRFVVNTLAPYVLTKVLLPIIPNDGRILNLSSAAQAPVNIQALKGEVHMGDMEAYAQSKLAITIWTQVMATEHASGPCFIAVNPGSLLASKMVTEGFGVAGNDLRIGADILCQLSLDASHAGETGKYWDNDAGCFAAPQSAAADPAHVADVMSAIADLT